MEPRRAREQESEREMMMMMMGIKMHCGPCEGIICHNLRDAEKLTILIWLCIKCEDEW